MKKKVAFLTTVFPMEIEYLLDFFNSLERQTYQYFDVVVVNDGYVGFEDIINQYPEINIIELKYSDTRAKNREYGINYVINNHYDILIFGDSDDYFKENRVEISLIKLLEYDIVINDLSLFNGDDIFSRHYISNRISNNTEIDLEFIKDKNIFGMSNSAIKLGKLEEISFDKELIAIDWYLFSILLIKGDKALFTTETETFYRQHGENIIGMGSITEEFILKGIDLKLRQYKILVKQNTSYNALLAKMVELQKKVQEKEIMYLLKNQDIKYPLWWEEIKLIKEKI